VNARAPLDLAMVQEDLLDVGAQSGSFSALLANLPASPGILAAFGDLEGLAEHRDRVLLAVLCNERKAASAGCARRYPALFLGFTRLSQYLMLSL
jgi:hypothetical protein